MMSFSMVSVNSGTLLSLNCKETVRANIYTSLVLVEEV
jgi:hypothetical protein